MDHGSFILTLLVKDLTRDLPIVRSKAERRQTLPRHLCTATPSLKWVEFSLEWLGIDSGESVASIMAIPGGRWLVILDSGGLRRSCESLSEAKSVAEECYRNLGQKS